MKKLFPKGVEGKLVAISVMIVLVIGIIFGFAVNIMMGSLRKMVIKSGEEQTKIAADQSGENVMALAKDSLFQMIQWGQDKTDDEFFILQHDILVLANQVEDVLSHPEKYETLSVEPPKTENDGEYSLQLLCPGAYDEISADTMEKMGKLANLAPMMEEMVSGNEGYTLDNYIALPNGVSICMDDLSGGKYDENGNIITYDATSRPWYKDAVAAGDVVFNPAHSHFYDFNEVIYSVPVYVDGELAAVLEGSSRLEILQRKLTDRNIGESGFSVLISDRGQLVCSPREEGELKIKEDITEDIRGNVNDELKEIINRAISGETGVTLTQVDGERYYVGFARLETIGWIQMSFISEEELLSSSESLSLQMRDASDKMFSAFNLYFSKYAVNILVLILILVTIVNITVRILAKRMLIPVNRMTEKVSEFDEDGMHFEMEDVFRTGDEIQVLAESFEEMSVKMKAYVEEIVSISAEKERIDTEMNMATQIQESMLPKIEPGFCGKKEYEIYARAVPAIDVGGDFYDFFYVDEDHLAIVLADVSGKGITAALLMALSKQVIQSQVLLYNGDVTAAMEAANLRLLEESVRDMFVTVWLGIVTLSTGKLIFVDAGHEYPAIRKGNGEFIIEKDTHSMAMAALKKAKFRLNEVYLKPGDVIYLYTDGVTEAHNPEGDMFGEKRLENALNEVRDAGLQEMDDHVRKRVTEFSDGAKQYDDITTLCFRYIGIE